ncbi:WD repeat-containing protein 26 [Asimina triloba]
MGGVEDDEPPPKRLKSSSQGLRSPSNNLCVAEPANLLRNTMARPLPSQGNDEMVGSKGLIKRVEFIRIITKALYSLGYERSGALLEEESGIPLHSLTVSQFRKQVLDGKWDESLATLHKISLPDDNIVKSASFLILEQKFFEFLDKEKVMDALKTLRSEISALGINRNRVHELSEFLVSPKPCVSGSLNHDFVGTNKRLGLLEKLQKLLPPTVMIPERRLEYLVEQALDVQRDACIFHNSLDNSLSLYSDHQCGKEVIPTQTLQAHLNEVWFLQFSNNGKYLASSSNDHTAIIWEVNDDGRVSLRHTLTGHQKPVLTLSWSPDDMQLLTCGLEEAVRRWDVNSGACLHVYEKTGLGLVSCGWFPDGKRIVSGVMDKSICMWDLDGKDLECWKGQRILKNSDMAVTSDGKWIISICRESVILLLDMEAQIEKLIEEQQTITSFSLSRDDKFLLVNLVNQEMHLWSIIGDPQLVTKYKGHRRTRFVIRSCFGGYKQAFIASGSEDSQVYIWHRSTGDPIEALPGHSGAVNCVSWNPTKPHMFASASDDRSIRIWGLKRPSLKRKETFSNGIVHCNGGLK